MNLLKLEMMDGTERIAEALKMRGLLVKTVGDHIVFEEGNTEFDMKETHRLMEAIGVPTFWQGNSFQVLVNRVPVSVMKRIINFQGGKFRVNMEGYHFKWKSFAQRRFGIKVNALEMDANMALFVKSLNAAGITALAGCNGHQRYSPNIQLSGIFQGAWFEILQEAFLNHLPLNYKWSVEYGNGSGSCIRAGKSIEEKWNMNLIYQDTVSMAEILLKHAEEIRGMKNQSFKRNREMKERASLLAESKNYQGLRCWMESQIIGELRYKTV